MTLTIDAGFFTPTASDTIWFTMPTESDTIVCDDILENGTGTPVASFLCEGGITGNSDPYGTFITEPAGWFNVHK